MDFIQLIGIMAGTLTSISFLPQAIKTWKSRSAKDLSLGMFLIFTSGVALWLTYGIIREDLPIILANIVTLVLSASILYFKLKYND